MLGAENCLVALTLRDDDDNDDDNNDGRCRRCRRCRRPFVTI